MIKPETPKPNHRFKDEVGKKPIFKEGGIATDCAWLDEAESIIPRKFCMERYNPNLFSVNYIMPPIIMPMSYRFDEQTLLNIIDELEKAMKK